MIAKFGGVCKVTGVQIVAGETEIVKVNGVWQAKPQARTKSNQHPPSVARAQGEVVDAYGETHTVYCYQYKGAYGHWRIWKIVNSAGVELDGVEWNFHTWGNRIPCNVGRNAKHCFEYAWHILNPIHTCEFDGIGG